MKLYISSLTRSPLYSYFKRFTKTPEAKEAIIEIETLQELVDMIKEKDCTVLLEIPESWTYFKHTELERDLDLRVVDDYM